MAEQVLVEDVKVMVLTVQNMVQEGGWKFIQKENGDVIVSNEQEELVFKEGNKLKAWLLQKSE